MFTDLRHALRFLFGHPGFFAAAVATLALGIGANTAMFTVVNEVLLQPLPYPDPHRVVKVWETYNGSRNIVSPANYFDWKARSHSFDQMAAFVPGSLSLSGLGDADRIPSAHVTAAFFGLLGVPAIAGRVFTPDDETGDRAIAVVRESFWRARLAADPNVVGRTLRLDGEAFDIVGVVPDRIEQPSRQTEIWLPLYVPETQRRVRGAHYLQVVARLKPGVTIEQAREDMNTIAADLKRENPETNARVGAGVFRLEDELVRGTRTALLLIFGATALVLLIACVNVAHLLLARGSGRRVEVAIRAALGASRGRIVRQLLTESLVIAVIGGAAGLFVAMWGTIAIRSVVPDAIAEVRRAGVDGSALAFTSLVAIVTAMMFGAFPALRLSSSSLEPVLRAQSRSGAPGRRAGNLLIALQVALAVVLVVSAGLLLASFSRLRDVKPGFDIDNLVVARISLPLAGYPKPENHRLFFRQVLDRLEGLPGIETAAAATRIPLRDQSANMTFTVDSAPQSDIDGVVVQEMSPEYIRALRLRLVRGRTLSETDARAGTAAMVSGAFARRAWGATDPVGRRFRMGPRWSDEGNPWITVVGLVDDVHQFDLASPAVPQVYLPYGQTLAWTPTEIVVRASLPPAAVFDAIRSAVRDLDRDLPVTALYTMHEVVDRSVARPRFNTILVGVFAALALGLALVGIYGVIAYSVGQRTVEIGIRVALGARREDVLRLIGGEGLWFALIGLVAGLAGAAAVSRVLAGMLFEVSPLDARTYALAAAAILVAALFSCLVPALRATRLDPARVLRGQ